MNRLMPHGPHPYKSFQHLNIPNPQEQKKNVIVRTAANSIIRTASNASLTVPKKPNSCNFFIKSNFSLNLQVEPEQRHHKISCLMIEQNRMSHWPINCSNLRKKLCRRLNELNCTDFGPVEVHDIKTRNWLRRNWTTKQQTNKPPKGCSDRGGD